MSNPWEPPPSGGFGPPPQQPPPQPGYGYPQPAPQPGYGYPQQQPPPGAPMQAMPMQQDMQPAFYPGPPPPPPGDTKKPGQAILLALVGALAAGFLYAVLLNAMFDDKDGYLAIGWASVMVGVVAGLGPGRFGGRSWGIYSTGAALALVGVIFGDLYGIAMVSADIAGQYSGGDISANKIFFENFGDLWDGWTEVSEPVDFILLLFAPAAALCVGGLFAAQQTRKLEQSQQMPPQQF
jgi:hypothetical protein